MQVQVNTDNQINGSEALTEHVENVVQAVLGRFSDRLTRVEVHLHDDNSDKSGDDDKRCVMEARPAGMQPVAVTQKAGHIHEAIDGAAEKLERLLETAFDKRDQAKGRTSMGGDQTI